METCHTKDSLTKPLAALAHLTQSARWPCPESASAMKAALWLTYSGDERAVVASLIALQEKDVVSAFVAATALIFLARKGCSRVEQDMAKIGVTKSTIFAEIAKHAGARLKT